ncbi:MAG: nuclear transport factor 2 family protein [Gemmatimonadales bacterium]|nr:nuclear transport factor 2 family protein [Gemmatimonadales bacterium]
MNRSLAALLLLSVLISPSRQVQKPVPVCGGQTQAVPLSAAAFRAMLDSVAVGWNSARPELAAGCFTETAVYLEPPDRQLYRGRAALLAFFAASILPARADRMRWQVTAFDSTRQVGFGEYTYRGRQNYHGVAVLQLQAGLIQTWREYQYGSPLDWEQFVGASR